MKKSSSLARIILTEEISSVTQDLGHRLNVLIDSMTDDNCKPLPSANAKLVEELQNIALELYRLNETTLPEASEDLVATIEAGW